MLPTVDDEPLLVVAGGGVAEHAAGLLVGLFDVFEPPRRPECLVTAPSLPLPLGSA